MELGVLASEFFTYSLISALLALCVVFPPQEFHQAGFTIPKLFYSLLGDERFSFVHYHLRRICVNIFVHASLPLLFFLVLELFFVPERIFSFQPTNIIQYLALSSLLLAIAAQTVVFFLVSRNWENHYVVRMLARYDANWRRIAGEIDGQCRHPVNFIINYNAYSRVIVTSDWLIRVSNYNVIFARIADSEFRALRSDRHPYLSTENNGVQMVDICVTSVNGDKFAPFQIRVHSQEMLATLQDQLGRPVHVAESVELPLPLHERFVDKFLETVDENPRAYPVTDELDSCLGCSATTANVRLMKTCVDVPPAVQQQQQDGGRSDDSCGVCRCRPMWCARCIGRIFASKQNPETPEVWMSGRAPCPTCRALFCALDVCYLS